MKKIKEIMKTQSSFFDDLDVAIGEAALYEEGDRVVADGTIGTIKKAHKAHPAMRGYLFDYSIKCDDGTYLECNADSIVPYSEMSAREYQTELLRMMAAHGGLCGEANCNTCPLLTICSKAGSRRVFCEQQTIEIVRRWAVEHPKPAPISKEDFEKLKAVHLLFGNCWVTKDEDEDVWLFEKEPIKFAKEWSVNSGISWGVKDAKFDCLSWRDEEPLRLTAEWLKLGEVM